MYREYFTLCLCAWETLGLIFSRENNTYLRK